MNKPAPLASLLTFVLVGVSVRAGIDPLAVKPVTGARLFQLAEVRLLLSPFVEAVAANREYLLEHDLDRLLAPSLREAGLQSRKPTYPNWESMGLQGDTVGHYLSALSGMIASGSDPDGEFSRRLARGARDGHLMKPGLGAPNGEDTTPGNDLNDATKARRKSLATL